MNRLRIFSFIFIFIILAAAVLLQDTAAGLFTQQNTETESIRIDNTLIMLNDLYERQLMDRLAELERQRADLSRRLEEDETSVVDSELQEALMQLQQEKARLEGEVDYVKQEASRLSDEQADSGSEELLRELADARKFYEAELAGLENKLAESLETNRQLTGALDLNLVEYGELESLITELQQQVEAGRRNSLRLEDRITGLQSETHSLADELELKNNLLRVQESERLGKEKTLEDELAKLTAAYSDSEQTRIGLESQLETLRRDLTTLEEQRAGLERRAEKLSRDYSNSEQSRAGLESQLAESEELRIGLESRLEALKGNLSESEQVRAGLEAKMDTIAGDLEAVIDKLFRASDISGVFINSPAGGLQTVVNPGRIDDALESPFLSVYDEDGREISKIILSEENGDYEYRVYPGYPEPIEGNWF